MIIVEGVDNSGKSTLVEQLCADLNLPLHERASDSIKGPVKDLAMWAQRDVLSWHQQPMSLYDRHPLISELIYGPVCRGGLPEGFDGGVLGYAYSQFVANSLVILCDPGWGVVRENLTDDVHQMPGVLDNSKLLYDLYHNLLFTWSWEAGNIVRYDYTQHPNHYRELLKDCKSHIQRKAQ